MIPYERQKKIIELLEDQELLKFEELKEQFDNISESTLRRDLKALEGKNRIEYLSGGAIKRRTAVGEIPIETRTAFNNKEKIKIGEI
ncbi:MAG: DeoR family transcriptional regulator, partial [Anaerococcus prevotii]|nr:DeoR family transcriptional regulator [Anaerococcus prevotii]